ncbi:hypothetical protein ABID29_000986 [Streptococcus rupicaprae]|uniref:Permease n=1 Tax=Streptococcus rupicaprae TaxID=759619 RepID=A0ABV2FH33_9STRE
MNSYFTMIALLLLISTCLILFGTRLSQTKLWTLALLFLTALCLQFLRGELADLGLVQGANLGIYFFVGQLFLNLASLLLFLLQGLTKKSND